MAAVGAEGGPFAGEFQHAPTLTAFDLVLSAFRRHGVWHLSAPPGTALGEPFWKLRERRTASRMRARARVFYDFGRGFQPGGWRAAAEEKGRCLQTTAVP